MSSNPPPREGPESGNGGPTAARRPSSVPPPLPRDADTAYYNALRKSGLLSEISDTHVDVLIDAVGPKEQDVRRLDLLEIYYAASGDEETAQRRARADRLLLHHEGDEATAHTIVARLAAINPELRGLRLERIGAEDGPLILRCGDHVSAVADEDEEDGRTISVRSIVQAVNVLLDRHEVAVRLMPLCTDGRREMYLGFAVSEALQLCAAGHLEETSVNQVLEFGAW